MLSAARILVVAAAFVVAPTASAASTPPCWQRVLSEWTEGSVQSSYSASCYAKALKRLPTDVRLYSDADEDIRRAMLAAIRSKGDPPDSGGASSATKRAGLSAAGVRADDSSNSRLLPLPLLFAITLALTFVAVGIVGRFRARRSAGREARPVEE